MPERFEIAYRRLGAILSATLASMPACALGPSDCAAGRADSTCLSGVVAAPVAPVVPPPPAPAPVPAPPVTAPGPFTLYDGPIGGVQWAAQYWGLDFAAHDQGFPSPASHDMYANRSSAAMTLKFTFGLPAGACGPGCLPRLELRLGTNWGLNYLPFDVHDQTASATIQVPPGGYYGWVIGMQSATTARLAVSVDPTNSRLALPDLGLPSRPDQASPVPPEVIDITCVDGTPGHISPGTHYSNGLMGFYTVDYYYAPDAWNDCPPLER